MDFKKNDSKKGMSFIVPFFVLKTNIMVTGYMV